MGMDIGKFVASVECERDSGQYGVWHTLFTQYRQDFVMLSHDEKKAVLIQLYREHQYEFLKKNNKGDYPAIYAFDPTDQMSFNLIVCGSFLAVVPECFSPGKISAFCDRERYERVVSGIENLKRVLDDSSEPWIANCVDRIGWQRVSDGLDDFLATTEFCQAEYLKNNQSDNLRKEGGDKKAKISAPDWAEVALYDGVDVCRIEKEFSSKIGLESVSQFIERMLSRESLGMVSAVASGHEVPARFRNILITGSSGVGKTASARHLGAVLACSGAVSKKQVVFASGAALLGKYVGHTEGKIIELIGLGRGGVIIIDEADSLCRRDSTTFHQSAVDTLNAQMGYEKDKGTGTIFIFTGYEGLANRLGKANEGANRRFPYKLGLPDYSNDQLLDIMRVMANNSGYILSAEAVEFAGRQLRKARKSMGGLFENAGAVENLVELAIDALATSVDPKAFDDALGGQESAKAFMEKNKLLGREFIPEFSSSAQGFVPQKSAKQIAPRIPGENQVIDLSRVLRKRGFGLG